MFNKNHVTILPEDLKNSDYTDGSDCPLARAIKREFGLEAIVDGCFGRKIEASYNGGKIIFHGEPSHITGKILPGVWGSETCRLCKKDENFKSHRVNILFHEHKSNHA